MTYAIKLIIFNNNINYINNMICNIDFFCKCKPSVSIKLNKYFLYPVFMTFDKLFLIIIFSKHCF